MSNQPLEDIVANIWADGNAKATFKFKGDGSELSVPQGIDALEAWATEQVIAELVQLITNINIAEGFKSEPNKALKWPNSLILARITELRAQLTERKQG